MSLLFWFRLLAAGVVGLVGLFVAAGAGRGTPYGLGLLGFAAAVVYGFALLKRYFDQQDTQRG